MTKSSGARQAILVLVAGLVVVAGAAEIAGSIGLSRISRIQKRIDSEAADSLHIPRAGTNGKPTMLLVGNSLLLEGADFPALKSMVAGKYDAHRFIIEQTDYEDWYFGLKRIFRHGSRPSRVVVALSVGSLLADITRGEFTAHYALDIQDFPEFARREHLDATTASNMLFAHYSGWLGTRAEIRKWLLGRILPDSADVANVLGFRPAPLFSPKLLRAIAPRRFRELKTLCNANGAEFSFLVLPVVVREDGSSLLQEIGSEMGVPVLVPAKPAEFPKELFRDGFHLSAKGAERFTPKLAEALITP